MDFMVYHGITSPSSSRRKNGGAPSSQSTFGELWLFKNVVAWLLTVGTYSVVAWCFSCVFSSVGTKSLTRYMHQIEKIIIERRKIIGIICFDSITQIFHDVGQRK